MRSLFLAAALLAVACQGPADAPGRDSRADAAPTVPLVIETGDGPRPFTMELAATPEAQARGLMDRPSLAEGHGMLFPFPFPRIASFWMKDTPQPLDLLFVSPGGRIAAILPGKPNDETPISTGEPVSAVIEIAGGSADRLGLVIGQRLRWGRCDPAMPDQPGRIADPARFCPH